ncbi:unnamed protein product [Closterium sp. Yama58-4]|nr:unnamed protein product [Closterium sp. Yama58-4]
MYGALQLVRMCEAEGLKPVIGNEMYLVHEEGAPAALLQAARALREEKEQGEQGVMREESGMGSGIGSGMGSGMGTVEREGVGGGGGEVVLEREGEADGAVKGSEHGEGEVGRVTGGEVAQGLAGEEQAGEAEAGGAGKAVKAPPSLSNLLAPFLPSPAPPPASITSGLPSAQGVPLVATNDSHFTWAADHRAHILPIPPPPSPPSPPLPHMLLPLPPPPQGVPLVATNDSHFTWAADHRAHFLPIPPPPSPPSPPLPHMLLPLPPPPQGVPLVATNDSHFTWAADHRAHQTLVSVKGFFQKYFSVCAIPMRTSRHIRGQEYVKSAEEMLESLQRTLPEEDALAALENSLRIADKVASYSSDLFSSKPKLPTFDVPPGHTDASWLESEARRGLQAVMGVQTWEAVPQQYRERLDLELRVICNYGLSAYFLIVADIIQFARRNDIPVGPGRGSAAGSLVAYALDIIYIDPIEHGLYFERFLSEERLAPPDIDSDFCPLGRDKILAYIAEKYGAHRVAQIATFNRMGSRAVLKDVGRDMQIPLNIMNELTKLVRGGECEGVLCSRTWGATCRSLETS